MRQRLRSSIQFAADTCKNGASGAIQNPLHMETPHVRQLPTAPQIVVRGSGPAASPPAHFIRVRVTHTVPLIEVGIAALLESAGQFELVGSSRIADVLVADLETGLRALGSGVCRNVLIVAPDDGETIVRTALEQGVRGFLLHDCEVDELLRAIRAVSRGETVFAPSVANRMVQSLAFDQLTGRELEVLQLMVHGLSDKDMARKLLIAPGTVKSHVRSILTKLRAGRRAEAAAIAQRRGIARLDRPLGTAFSFNVPPVLPRALEEVRAR
jgi:DNA-binding NarL/FixJ family response regulator